jgi:hypothetical protein
VLRRLASASSVVIELLLTWSRCRAGCYHLGMPVDAQQDIADLAAIINRLWGASTGAPVTREVMVVGWDHRTVMSGLAAYYDTGPLSDSAVLVIVRGDPRYDFGSYDTRYATTGHPCDYLWGPGPWPEASAWFERENPDGDNALTLDRLFMLRCRDRLLALPQDIPVAPGLDGADTEGTWYLIRPTHLSTRSVTRGSSSPEYPATKPLGHASAPWRLWAKAPGVTYSGSLPTPEAT